MQTLRKVSLSLSSTFHMHIHYPAHAHSGVKCVLFVYPDKNFERVCSAENQSKFKELNKLSSSWKKYVSMGGSQNKRDGMKQR